MGQKNNRLMVIPENRNICGLSLTVDKFFDELSSTKETSPLNYRNY